MKRIRTIVFTLVLVLVSSIWAGIFLNNKSSVVKAQVSNGGIVTDLNGDGKLDTIKYIVKDLNTCSLTVNGISIVHTGFNPGKSISIIDIEKKDKLKEIILTDNKSDNTNSSYYYFYNGLKIIFLGKVDGSNMVYYGDGTFVAEIRASILETWYYKAKYHINSNHKIVLIPKKLYEIGDVVTVKKSIRLQKSPTDSTTVAKLSVGEKVTILYGDTRKWFIIKTSKKVNGWLAVKDCTKIVGTNYNSWDVFDNLTFID